MFELTIQSDISSAHFLRGYEGKCKNLHGHTWRIEVTIQGQHLDTIGMVADFAVLKKQLKEFLMPIDHVCLNDIDYFKKHNPTTENIAKYVYDGFSKEVFPLKILKTQAWESPTSSVTYYPS